MLKTHTWNWSFHPWLIASGITAIYTLLWSTRADRALTSFTPHMATISRASNPYSRSVLTPLVLPRTSSEPPVFSYAPKANVPAIPAPRPPAAPANNSPTPDLRLLDQHRTFALGMIETGNNDYEVGQAGEVSRYQIMPAVWKRYSRSERYEDSGTATVVARRHWSVLYAGFKRQARREPTDLDMYVLWNTRYGYYASKGFRPAGLHPEIRNRARHFENLVKWSAAQLAAARGAATP